MSDPGAEFTRQKIIIRWSLPDGVDPDEHEDRAHALAAAIDPILDASGLAEINGFEFGGGEIDALIFGRETDDDVDAIYESIVEVFRAFGCPAGSCIIRQYRDRGDELVTDVV